MEIESAHFPQEDPLSDVHGLVVQRSNLCNFLPHMNWCDFLKGFFIIVFGIMTVLVWVIDQKPHPQPPLCDKKLYVALDGSMPYTTISGAVNATTPFNPLRTCIFIKEGTYVESLTVPTEKINIAFLCEGADKTILTSNNLFNVFSTGTLKIQGRGFLAMNLAIVNTANPDQGEEAVALENWGEESIFYRCRFVGYRRTLYAVAYKQFYRENEIQGSSYFIYGDAQAVFQKCTIKVVRNGNKDIVVSGNVRSSPGQDSAFVFQMCEFVINPLASSTMVTTQVYLGAPLTAYSTEVVMESYLDSLVVGWQLYSPISLPCPKTAFLAEFKNKGAGARNRNLSACTQIIKEPIANRFSVRTFFNDSLEWIPTQIPVDLYIG